MKSMCAFGPFTWDRSEDKRDKDKYIPGIDLEGRGMFRKIGLMYPLGKVDGDDDNDGNHADGDHNDHCDYSDDEGDDAEADICTWLRQLVPAPFTSYLLATQHHST